MKTFTILEALQIISETMPINLNILVSIEFINNNYFTFLLKFKEGTKYIIDLDDETYKKL